MKKICSLLLVLCLIASLSACGNDSTANNEKGRYCVECGGEISATDKFCGSCGVPVSKANDTITTDNTNKSTTAELSTIATTSTTITTTTTTMATTTTTKATTTTTKATTSTTRAATTKTKHTHQYIKATCTEPAKCFCGATKGKALGHTWEEATCKAPKTCSACKKTQGKVAKHTYNKEGLCSFCDAKDPDFSYPSLSTMSTWTSWQKKGRSLVALTHRFFDNMYSVSEWIYESEASLLSIGETIDHRESVEWEGVRYYALGGGELLFTTFLEEGDQVFIGGRDGCGIYKRTSTKTMEVVSFNSSMDECDALIPEGAILTYKETED